MRFRSILSTFSSFVLLLSTFSTNAKVGTAHGLSSDNAGGEVRRWEVTGPWGGDVRTLVAKPDNADVFFLGTSDGQIFRSTDGTRSWARLQPGLGKSGLSVDCLVIDPRNPRTIYAGAWAVARNEEGGIFKSEDDGATWKLLGATKGFSVRSLAMAPSDSSFLIAGTANDDKNLNGAFRSTDSGKTWERISPEGDREIRNIESVAIDPLDTSIVYVGTFHLPWKTTNGGSNWKQTGYKATGMIDDSDIFGISVNLASPTLVYMNACSGIYRSTSAGEKWMKLPGIPFSARRTYTLLAHPNAPNTLFAGTSEGLWRSLDGGKRWMLLTSKNAVIRSIVITADQPERVVIATDGFGVQISNNLGTDFSLSNDGFIHRHVLAILPDATEHGRVLASVFHDGPSGSVFESDDDGKTWKVASRGLGARDVYSFYQAPDNPEVVYAGTNNGVYRSSDRGASWSFLTSVIKPEAPVKKPVRSVRKGSRRTGSKSSTSKSAGASHSQPARQSTSYKVVPTVSTTSGSAGGSTAGSTKRSTKKPVKKSAHQRSGSSRHSRPVRTSQSSQATESSESSQSSPSTRSGGPAETPKGPTRASGKASGQQSRNSTSHRSSRVSQRQPRKPVVVAAAPVPSGPPMVDLTKQVDDITSFVDAEGHHGLLAATMDGLYRTFDETKGWEKVVITDYDPMGRVFAISTHKDAPKTVYVGTKQGLFISHDGTATWDHVDRGPNDMFVKAIAQSPVDPNLIIVGTNQFVYRTTNGGKTWVMRGGGISVGDYTSVRFNPINPNEVLIADYSKGGVFRSVDKGYYWERIDTGLPSSRVWTLTFDPFEKNRVYAGSFSSGVYVLTIQQGNQNRE